MISALSERCPRIFRCDDLASGRCGEFCRWVHILRGRAPGPFVTSGRSHRVTATAASETREEVETRDLFQAFNFGIPRLLTVLAGTMLVIAGMAVAPAIIAKDGSDAGHWVGTWSASPQAAWHPLELDGQTIRQIVHVSIGGTRVRVRLSNAYGAGALLIGAARVGLRSTGASIVPGSGRVLTFNGSESTTIPAGALAISDPVSLRVPDRGDLAVSIYVPGTQLAATEHSLGLQTTYISAGGGFQRRRLTADGDHYPVLLLSDRRRSGRLHDSQGNRHARRLDNRRLALDYGRQQALAESSGRAAALAKGGSKIAVLNAGISGNRLLHDTVGTNASARLDRDVLVQSGARYVIVLLGINDIGFPGTATADEIIAGHRQIIDRAHAMGLKVYGGTLTPFQAFLPGIYYTRRWRGKAPGHQPMDQDSKAYDAVIDFDKAIRDPGNPATMRPAYDSGDNLHPNDAGYQAMADAIDLSLFRSQRSGRRAVDCEKPASAAGQADGETLPVPALIRQRSVRKPFLELQDRRLDEMPHRRSPAGSSVRVAPQREETRASRKNARRANRQAAT